MILKSPASTQPSIFFDSNRLHSTHHYTLPSPPSPLRTSRNANLTPRPDRKNGLLMISMDSSPLGSMLGAEAGRRGGAADENVEGMIRVTPHKESAAATATIITPPHSGGRSHRPAGARFEWEGRARSSSPGVVLARHAADERERRKSQFLDRIRRRRDEGRSDVYNDQVLRMDFVRERREWEEDMARRAMREVPTEDNVDMDLGDEHVEAEEAPEEQDLSPMEEHEMDELVSYYLVHGQNQARNERENRQASNGDEEGEDDDYDQIFMEVIGANQRQHEDTEPQLTAMAVHAWDRENGHPSPGRLQPQHDSSMDLT